MCTHTWYIYRCGAKREGPYEQCEEIRRIGSGDVHCEPDTIEKRIANLCFTCSFPPNGEEVLEIPDLQGQPQPPPVVDPWTRMMLGYERTIAEAIANGRRERQEWADRHPMLPEDLRRGFSIGRDSLFSLINAMHTQNRVASLNALFNASQSPSHGHIAIYGHVNNTNPQARNGNTDPQVARDRHGEVLNGLWDVYHPPQANRAANTGGAGRANSAASRQQNNGTMQANGNGHSQLQSQNERTNGGHDGQGFEMETETDEDAPLSQRRMR